MLDEANSCVDYDFASEWAHILKDHVGIQTQNHCKKLVALYRNSCTVALSFDLFVVLLCDQFWQNLITHTQKNPVSKVALLPGKCLCIRKVFAHLREQPVKVSQYLRTVLTNWDLSRWFEKFPASFKTVQIFPLWKQCFTELCWLFLVKILKKASLGASCPKVTPSLAKRKVTE